MSMQDEAKEDGVDLLAVIDAECGKDDFMKKEDGISREAEHCIGQRGGDKCGCTEEEEIDEDTGPPNSDVFSRLGFVDA